MSTRLTLKSLWLEDSQAGEHAATPEVTDEKRQETETLAKQEQKRSNQRQDRKWKFAPQFHPTAAVVVAAAVVAVAFVAFVEEKATR